MLRGTLFVHVALFFQGVRVCDMMESHYFNESGLVFLQRYGRFYGLFQPFYASQLPDHFNTSTLAIADEFKTRDYRCMGVCTKFLHPFICTLYTYIIHYIHYRHYVDWDRHPRKPTRRFQEGNRQERNRNYYAEADEELREMNDQYRFGAGKNERFLSVFLAQHTQHQNNYPTVTPVTTVNFVGVEVALNKQLFCKFKSGDLAEDVVEVTVERFVTKKYLRKEKENNTEIMEDYMYYCTLPRSLSPLPSSPKKRYTILSIL
jgi:hypothetical protein